MASVAECASALDTLARRSASKRNAQSGSGFDRTLSCRLRDLDVVFAGNLANGELRDIREIDAPTARSHKAQIALDLTSDDLIELVEGRLNVASAWAAGRIKIDARKLDLLRLRTIF